MFEYRVFYHHESHVSRLTPDDFNSLLTAHRSPFTAHRSLLTAHCSPLTAYRTPHTAHRSLLTAHCSLLTAHCSLLTAHGSTCFHSSLCYSSPTAAHCFNKRSNFCESSSNLSCCSCIPLIPMTVN